MKSVSALAELPPTLTEIQNMATNQERERWSEGGAKCDYGRNRNYMSPSPPNSLNGHESPQKRTKTALGPHEILTGWPMWVGIEPPPQECLAGVDGQLRNYMISLSKVISSLYSKVKAALSVPGDKPQHSYDQETGYGSETSWARCGTVQGGSGRVRSSWQPKRPSRLSSVIPEFTCRIANLTNLMVRKWSQGIISVE